jgi:hypothetical protein
MPDARHPKQYPQGAKHPKREVTPSWKKLVLQVLDRNLKAGRSPSSPTELARAVGAHKTGMLRMLGSDQATYKYVRQICEVLDIPEPTKENSEISSVFVEEDEWSAAVAAAKALPPDQQRRALRALKALVDETDS